MFTRKPDKDGVATDAAKGPPGLNIARPRPAPLRAGERGVPSVIGPDLVVTGNLEARGEIQVEGEVQGDIQAGRIVVGERARVTGGLVADEVVVRGSLMGSIRGNTVTLQSTSHVEGDIFHKMLAIEEGAYFEGKSRRSDDPMSVQRTSNGMPPPA
jgi:cytoskeletal protein CcmA (bactofilin family)